MYGNYDYFSCRWCMFVSCVHPVAVVNFAFCMTCSVLMLDAAIWKGILQSLYHDCCCCCMPFSTIRVVNPGSPGLESSGFVSS